jgi:hypothetical protein
MSSFNCSNRIPFYNFAACSTCILRGSVEVLYMQPIRPTSYGMIHSLCIYITTDEVYVQSWSLLYEYIRAVFVSRAQSLIDLASIYRPVICSFTLGCKLQKLFDLFEGRRGTMFIYRKQCHLATYISTTYITSNEMQSNYMSIAHTPVASPRCELLTQCDTFTASHQWLCHTASALFDIWPSAYTCACRMSISMRLHAEGFFIPRYIQCTIYDQLIVRSLPCRPCLPRGHLRTLFHLIVETLVHVAVSVYAMTTDWHAQTRPIVE